jgi:anti-anti-sigma regulatory factor
MSAEQNKKRKAATPKKKSQKAEHLLSGDLTLQVAAEVKAVFVKALAAKGDVTFRFEEVGDVDLSFIQILCSAHRSAHDDGKKFIFTGEWPESFATLLDESGLNVHVGCSLDSGVECPWILDTNQSK